MALPTRAAAALSAAALSAVAVLLFAGCTAGPGSTAPSSTPVPSSSADADADDVDDMEAAILDDGRLFAVMTWGSSTCVPQVDTVSATGQTVSVELVETDANAVCTADMTQRASVGALPEGVDPTKEISLQVTYGDVSDDIDVDGDASFTGTPGSSTEYMPSAAWFDDGSLVLLTWGSSGCPPVLQELSASGATGTATFVTDDDKACTMDMAPRATIISFGDDQVEDDDFTLTLVGGGLDGTVSVRG
nr:hypothetical protein [Microbacterium hydrocarbonoxydans]